MIEDSASMWLKQALHDLEMAERNLAFEGYDVTAFLSHQAVEKLLKALILSKGSIAPRIHSTEDLARSLELSEELISSLSELDPDYFFSRYPDMSDHVPYEQYDKELAQEKLNIAKRVFNELSDLYKSILEREHNGPMDSAVSNRSDP